MTTATVPLTHQQLAAFRTFGFLALPGLLADRIDRIIAEFEAIWAANGGGHNGRAHDGSARSCSVQFVDQSEELSTLLDDPRIHGVAASILGDDFNYMGSDGNFYTGNTGWHSDGYGGRGGPLHIKIAFYLDPLTPANGALRVIPGSHRIGEPFADELERSIRASEQLWGLPGDQVPALGLPIARRHPCVQPRPEARRVWGLAAPAHVYHELLPALPRRQATASARLHGRRGALLDRAGLWRGYDPHRQPRAYAAPRAVPGQRRAPARAEPPGPRAHGRAGARVSAS